MLQKIPLRSLHQPWPPELPTPEGDLLVTRFTFAFAEILGVNPARTGPRSYWAEQHEQWNVSAVSH